MRALDELLRKWRDNPDVGTTLALCTYLGAAAYEEALIREVGTSAETWHRQDPQVMLAIGRMYLDAGLLAEAQGAFVAAGKADPRVAAPYRYLGEVLLRRGDAARAEKVLARAIGLGQTDSDTRMWHDRAAVYTALQKRVGMEAVADEIERVIPRKVSVPPPAAPTPPPPHAVAAALPTVPSPPPSSRPPELEPVAAPPPPAPLARVPAPPRLPAFAQEVEKEQPGTREPLDPDTDPASDSASAPSLRAGTPAPETVLQHLAQVGVYERDGGAAPSWESAPRQRSRGSWVLVAAILLAAGSGYGGYEYARQVKEQRLARARQLETEVARLLSSGRVEELEQTDAKLGEAFDLDSRSQEAALLWLQNRVLSGLLRAEEPRGIESAVHRARTVGVPERALAFGRIASFLSEGDIQGAAALLPKWDEQAAKDAYYQLVAGAMLERAGDARAVGRYAKAAELDPELAIARILHAQLVAIELGAEAVAPIVEELGRNLPERVEVRALKGLHWAVNADAPEGLPAEARIDADALTALPVPLRALPSAVRAQALSREGRPKEALSALDSALRLSVTPAMAAWLGYLAIDLGDVSLARRAALRALASSALYPRARALAARVALLDARLDEAKQSIQGLDPAVPEVSVVRAAVAYELLHLADLEGALEALGEEAAGDRGLRALVWGSRIALGTGYPDAEAIEEMAGGGVAWGDLVAMDAALDRGELDLAEKLLARWGDGPPTAVHALRAARAHRYAGRLEAALRSSEVAARGESITPRALVERFEVLRAGDPAGARDLVARYPALLGPITDWLKALADAAKNPRRARALVARLELPPPETPLLLQVLVAEALAEVGDRRAKQQIGSLLRRAPRHPDLVAAAKTVGLLR